MMTRTHMAAALAAACMLANGPAPLAQTYNPNPRGRTTARPSEYTISNRNQVRRPRAYSAYYNAAKLNGYMVSPFVVAPLSQSQPIVLGPVRPYSPDEYAQLVISGLEAGGIAPVVSRDQTESVVVPFTNEDGEKDYEMAEATVQDVLDRGVLLLTNGEQVKLRGVRVPTERDPNEFTRLYAREAIGALRALTQGRTVYLVFEEPLRNSEGSILATVYQNDGTNLNKHMLIMGYGQVQEDDYYGATDLSILKAAEQAARDARVGLWSK